MPALDEDLAAKLVRHFKGARKERMLYSRKSTYRTIWKNLGLALAATPMVFAVLFVIGVIVGRLAEAVTELESTAGTWALLVLVSSVAYVASLIYLLYQSRVHRNREREEMIDERKRRVDTLILYWREQLVKKSNPQPSGDIIKVVQEMFLQRLRTWARSDPELWVKYFPNEKYSKHFFGIVDNFMNYWEDKGFEELTDYWESLTHYWVSDLINRGKIVAIEEEHKQ